MFHKKIALTLVLAPVLLVLLFSACGRQRFELPRRMGIKVPAGYPFRGIDSSASAAIASDGTIYIAEKYPDPVGITRILPDGTMERGWVAGGSSVGHVFVGTDDRLWAIRSDRLVTISTSGAVTEVFGSTSVTPSAAFAGPNGTAAVRVVHVSTSTEMKRSIFLITPEGGVTRRYDAPTTGSEIVFDSEGNLYAFAPVTPGNPGRTVQRFGADGSIIETWATDLQGYQLAAHPNGTLYTVASFMAKTADMLTRVTSDAKVKTYYLTTRSRAIDVLVDDRGHVLTLTRRDDGRDALTLLSRNLKKGTGIWLSPADWDGQSRALLNEAGITILRTETHRQKPQRKRLSRTFIAFR